MFLQEFEKYNHPLFGYIKMPKIEVDKQQIERLKLSSNPIPEEYLKALIYEGLNKKITKNKIKELDRKIYIERIEEEYGVITDLGFTSYILLVYEILRFCRENDILNSPSRGSVGGSLVCYLIEITQIDPIKHGLLFSRFLSAVRAEKKEINGEIYIKSDSCPDIDIDSTHRGKPLVQQKINSMFPQRTVGISNISTLQSKVLIKEVLKTAWEWNESQTKIASDLIEKAFGNVASIKDSLEKNKIFAKWAQGKEEIISICLKLQDLIKNKSVHAAGILICDQAVQDMVPVEYDKDKNLVCSYDMESAQAFGIKLDNLAVLQLDICQDCLKIVGLTFEDIDVNDPSIYKFLCETDKYYGLFQVSEGLGKKTLHKIQPKNIDDIIASIALARPGSYRFVDDYVGDKIDRKKIDPRVLPLLEETKGIIIYQETIMKLAVKMADFSAQESDKLRKGLGKKIKEVVMAFKNKFKENAIKNKYSLDFIEWCWETVEASADYSFNKCAHEEDTVFEENRGKIMLKEVKIGDKIKAYNTKENSNHYVEVLDAIWGERELFEIVTENGKTLRISMEHKLLCEDCVMRPLKTIIAEGHLILTD